MPPIPNLDRRPALPPQGRSPARPAMKPKPARRSSGTAPTNGAKTATASLWVKDRVTFPVSKENGVIVRRPVSVPADTLGTLAIHPQLDGRSGWSITHVPTHCKIIHMPDEASARDVAELLWFVAGRALAQPAKGLIDMALFCGDIEWVKPWLGQCMKTGRLVPTVTYERG